MSALGVYKFRVETQNCSKLKGRHILHYIYHIEHIGICIIPMVKHTTVYLDQGSSEFQVISKRVVNGQKQLFISPSMPKL